MSCKIDVDLSGLTKMFGEENVKRVNKQVSLRAKDLMEPFVPKQYGALRGSAKVNVDNVEYLADYAPYVYAKDDANWTTKGTHGHWDRDLDIEELEQLAVDLLTKG